MPTWDEILSIIKKEELPELKLLDQYVKKLAEHTKRTIICYMSAFTLIKPPVPSVFHSIIDQDIQGFMTCTKGVSKDGLDLILHTPGGDYEATKRIINYLIETYKHIRVIVPHLAMSGGTLLACASDEIYMGPYSSLGPTDPQIYLGGGYVPVDAIINECNEAFEQVSSDPSKALLWNERLKQIPFGKLKAIENMRDNALDYVKILLETKNCHGEKAEKIEDNAKFLSSHEGHSSHGKGISLKDVVGRLNVVDLRSDRVLEDLVLSIYHSATLLFQKSHTQKIIINNNGRRYLTNYTPPVK